MKKIAPMLGPGPPVGIPLPAGTAGAAPGGPLFPLGGKLPFGGPRNPSFSLFEFPLLGG